jgi:hypothetical protein
MLPKMCKTVGVLGVTVFLIGASVPTDAGAYTCGYRGGHYGHGCYDRDYGGRRYFRHWCCGGGYGRGHYDYGCYGDGSHGRECYGDNHYGRRLHDCGCGRDYGGYGHDYDGYGRSDGYGGSDGDGSYSGDYNPACRSCVSPACRRYYRCE